jgi:hypothetical protein
MQIMPFATADDLKEAMFLMEHASGVRPYIQDWHEQVFLPTFEAKTEPDSKYIPSSGITKTEDMIAVTSEQLVAATQAIQHKTFTNQKILETYLEPLMNEGYVDRVESAINRSWKIYYPTRLNSETRRQSLTFDDILWPKSNDECQDNKSKPDKFERELPPDYMKINIEKVVSHSSAADTFCEIFDHEHNSLTVDKLLEKYYPHPPQYRQQPLESEPKSEEDKAAVDNPDAFKEKNSCFEKGGVFDDRQAEPKSSPVSQTEAKDVRSTEKTEKSNDESEPHYCCKYCNLGPVNQQEYERHVVTKHPRMPGYPDKNGRS